MIHRYGKQAMLRSASLPSHLNTLTNTPVVLHRGSTRYLPRPAHSSLRHQMGHSEVSTEIVTKDDIDTVTNGADKQTIITYFIREKQCPRLRDITPIDNNSVWHRIRSFGQLLPRYQFSDQHFGFITGFGTNLRSKCRSSPAPTSN